MRIPAASPPVALCVERGPRGEIIPEGPLAGGDAEARLDARALRVEGERRACELAPEGGEVARGLDPELARAREAHPEDAARMRHANGVPLQGLDPAGGMQVEARASAHGAPRLDAVADEEDPVRVPGEAPRVPRRAGEARIAIVPPFEREAARPLAEDHVAGPPAPRHAERRPHLALVLTLDLDRVVGPGRAAVRAPLVGLVAEDPRVDDGPRPRERELEREEVGVGVAREMIGADRRGVADHVVTARFASPEVARLGEGEGARGRLRHAASIDPL